MATFKCYFSTHVSQETHPQITDRKSAVAIAKSSTTNEVGDFDWEEDEKCLNFSEYVFAEADSEEDLEGMEEMPQIKDAEFSGASKLRKPRN